MKSIVGTSNRIIEINLSTASIQAFQVDDDDRRQYLGGAGLGLKLLYERMTPGADPLGEENWLAFMMGVLMGTGAPCSGRFAAVTKSPLTGIMLTTTCGGPFGMAYKTAGYDGLLVTGCAATPVVVEIDGDGVNIEDGRHLWGLDTRETQQQLNLNRNDGALVIGPAGENQVLFASVASGTRFIGRGGVGAVMGAKGIKAIVARGRHCKIVPADPKRFADAKRRATRDINSNPITADDYRNFGTASHVNGCNAGGILPVCNFHDGSHSKADQVSGETLCERYQPRPSTCKPCSIICGHKGRLADGRVCRIPEYESVALLGPNLGIFDPDFIVHINDRCGLLGLDPISAGGVLAWCMEAGEKGLVETELKFGVTDGIEQALEDTAYRRGWGEQLADGTRLLSQRYGGSEFAIQVKGMELSGYDPRGAWGLGLADAVANPGTCHHSAAIFFLEVVLGWLNPYTTRAKARFVYSFENLYAAIHSLVTCPYTAYAYLFESPLIKYMPTWLIRAWMQYVPRMATRLMDVRLYVKLWRSITGERLTPRQFLKAGERIHLLERLMNTGAGISRKDDTLPCRMLNEARQNDEDGHTVPLRPMLDDYYLLRGYDLHGIPTRKTLARLAIEPKWTLHSDPRTADFRMIRPRGKLLKNGYLTVMFWFVGRAVEASARSDREARKIAETIPEGFSFRLGVAPDGPSMLVDKDRRGKLRYLGHDTGERCIDLKLTIKSIDAAMLLFTFKEATVTAVTRNRLTVDGDTAMACRFLRLLDRVEVYLLPKALAQRAVRRYPSGSPWRKFGVRILIYLRTVLGI